MEKFFGKDKNILVIYHGNCRDGFASAYVAWKKFGGNADYVPQIYGKEYAPHNVKDKEVYILDFTYNKEDMLRIENTAKKLVAIDHHASAEGIIKNIKEYVFDLNYSGAYLTHKYFFPKEKVPRLIQYVSDYDTFKNELPHTKEVTTYIYKDDLEVLTFNKLSRLEKELEDDKYFDSAIKTGNIINYSENRQINYFKEKAQKVIFDDYEVYAVNAPRDLRSDLGFLLAEDTHNFAMVFFYEDGVYKCSLRSANGFDVSKIAEKYGGGGHKNQALFIVPENFELTTSLNKV